MLLQSGYKICIERISFNFNIFNYLWFSLISFDFLYHFPYENQENKILHFGWHIVSNLVSGVQYTVTNAICCKISLMYNSLVCRIIVLRIFVSWMCECVTKNKIKSIVVSKADYSCIWFLNSGIITTKYPKNHTHKISAQSV